jgi:hypothetical protein
MRSVSDIRQLLNELDTQPATDLEDQDLDFKDWSRRSTAKINSRVKSGSATHAGSSPALVMLSATAALTGRQPRRVCSVCSGNGSCEISQGLPMLRCEPLRILGEARSSV